MIQLKQNNDIEYQGFSLTENGFKALGSPTFKQWEEVGRFIKRSHKAVKFWQGDWLNFGEDNFDEWTQYFDPSEPDSEALKVEKWVAKRIPLERRHTNLSWSHHEEVADLDPEEQEQMFKIAEENKMSIKRFKGLVKTYQLKLDSELDEEDLKPTDPKVFEKVQEVIDSSIHTVELLEKIDLTTLHKDARDYLFSHLRKVFALYFDLLKRYDKQKSVSKKVVQG